MKKVLIGVLLVFAFVFTGCPTDISTGIPMDTPPTDIPPEIKEEPPETKEEDKTTKFEGTWVIEAGSVSATYRFTNENFVFSSDDTAETYFAEGPLSGTFEFTETTITFTLSDNSKIWTMDYTLENGDLSLSNSQGDNPTKLENGTLTKQNTKEEDKTAKFEGTWRNYGTDGEGTFDLNYTFTGNTFVGHEGIEDFEFSGTFTYTSTTITFILSDGTSRTQEYILEGNTLTLDPEGKTYYWKGTFIKQPFEGAWKNPLGSNATYTFTGNDFSVRNNNNVSYSGTFTFTDTTITLNANDEYGHEFTWTVWYGFSSDKKTLMLDNEDGIQFYGSFEKQP